MKTINKLDVEEWDRKYSPIKNNIVDDASFGGTMFETYGQEYEFVRVKNNHKIWTLLDGEDGSLIILNGWHFVNRIGYFITKNKWTKDCEVKL